MGAALAAAADQAGPLTLTIRGVCVERVRLRRDRVSLRGASAGDGLQAPATGSGQVLVLEGARSVTLSNLTLDGNGSDWGLLATSGSSFFAVGLNVRRATFGVAVAEEALGSLVDSEVEDSSMEALDVSGSLRLTRCRILRAGRFGLFVRGEVSGVDGAIDGALDGIVVSRGGRLVTSGFVVTNSRNLGIQVELGSTARLSSIRVSDNASTGLQHGDCGRLHALPLHGCILLRCFDIDADHAL